VRNMGNSYGLKGKGIDLSEGPSKRKRDVVPTPAAIEGPPKRKRDVVPTPAAIETPLVPAENAPSSSGWHNNVVLLLDLMMSFFCPVFSWAFPSYTLKFDFSFSFGNFVWVLKIFLDPYNHDSLLSSQSIKRRRFSSDLNSQPIATIPFSH